ncbi:heparan-alpha-glucosaminide N-acetyltransferase [Folsomia candida]|uniref:Heparan-alpha-glucosaminide N-acetyltransferase n=1 Tax=Folsomia candida TaxID=158441 RepID=A0A226E344_FOLCA|nr:heparan-alpha-glucosaminide N-acetyltransferase [Folsomia candida]OXA51690.1 Heparan-alpha-glucosaminide N-acetyltransferase [Folsomia candida]
MSWIEKQPFSTFRGFNLTELKIDEAWMNVTNLANQTLWLYQRSTDCYECPFKLRDDLDLSPGDNTAQFKVSTKFPIKYRFRTDASSRYVLEDGDQSIFCETEASLGEFGVYDLTADITGKCSLETQLEPVNIYLPLVLAAIFYCLLTIGALIYQTNKARIFPKIGIKQNNSVKSATEKETPAPVVKQRLRSLDTFRGLCIIIMIFVNDGGAQYWFFEHATWDGLYVADLVFPWFLWIMGVVIPVSIKSQLRKKIPKSAILKGILIRSLKLIGIGLMLASRRGPINPETFRLPGVLQRFGVCYFVAASLMLLSASEDFVTNRIHNNKIIRIFQDITILWKGWLLALSIIMLHTLLTFLLKVPGCPTGYLGPGGIHLYKDIASYPSPSHCIGGAAGYIDTQILTIHHIFKFPTALSTYEAGPFDPEGILGTLPSIFQVWLGVQTGMTLQVFPTAKARLIRWSLWAILTGGVGAALSSAKQTGGLIPLNKNLWSLSYVAVTTCFALLLLITLFVLIDLKKWWSGSPFYEPGMNSILLYVGHSVGYVILPFHFGYKAAMVGTHFVRLVEALWGTSLWVLIAIYLCNIEYFWTL